MLGKLRTLRAVLTQYGLADTLWRLRYNRQKKQGRFAKEFPAFAWSNKSLSDYFNTDGPQSPGGVREYLKSKAGTFLFAPDRFPHAPQQWRENAVRRADALVERGEFEYFFCPDQLGRLGYPEVDWFKNPFTDQRDTEAVHWSLRGDFNPERGDIKFIWEPSRFAWACDLARAYAATGDDRYPEAFWLVFESWLDANPPMIGSGWQCGQETAIRVMGVCFALWAFMDHPASTESRLERALLMLAFCGDRIESNVEYARRQRSNHSTTEAVGLFILAVLMPQLKKAPTFLEIARGDMLADAENDFWSDGGYMQHSMNYQRMTMHCFLWYLALAGNNDLEVPHAITEKLRKALGFLYQLQDETGRVPNYGSNDGALLCPWSDSDYLDYRPMLGAMYFALEGKRLYPEGPWDEEALWFFGKRIESAESPEDAELIPRVSQQFSVGGYYSIRNANSWAMVRCHTYKSRPSQADQLHVDLWWKGINLLRDTGTFAYYDPQQHRNLKFISSAMHNTIEIDGQSQMTKGPRFYWTRLSSGKCDRADEKNIEVRHDGYKRLGVIHSRRIESPDETTWRIRDVLKGRGQHSGMLRWFLPNYPAQVENETLILDTPQGRVTLQIISDATIELQLRQEQESLYYGHLSPVQVLEVAFNEPAPVELTTLIQLPD
jgi:hypothetical protein